jgi:hypothetical protein
MQNKRIFTSLARFLFLTFTLSMGAGCATFFGTARPVEEKAQDYQIVDLTRLNANWVKQSPEKISDAGPAPLETGADSALADRSWVSTRTGSIITLNTVCRPSHARLAHTGATLRDLSQQLFLGLGDIRMSEERELSITGTPAFERTTEGSIQDRPGKARTVKMRTLTLLHGECLFDFMLVSAPSKFPEDQDAFQKLVDSLRLATTPNP